MGNFTGHTPASPGSPLGPPAAQKLGLGWRCKPKIAAEMLLPQHVQDGTGMEASARHTPTALGRRPEPTPQLEMGKTPRDDGKDAPRGTVAAGRGCKVWFRSPSSTSNPSYFMQSHRQHPSRAMPVFFARGKTHENKRWLCRAAQPRIPAFPCFLREQNEIPNLPVPTFNSRRARSYRAEHQYQP